MLSRDGVLADQHICGIIPRDLLTIEPISSCCLHAAVKNHWPWSCALGSTRVKITLSVSFSVLTTGQDSTS